MDEYASDSDSDSDEPGLLLDEIEEWDGTDMDALRDFMESICEGFDANDKDATEWAADWSNALLQHTLPPFERARLNLWLAFTPLEWPQDRLDIATVLIHDAADEEDISGMNVSDDIVSWKNHIISTRDNYWRNRLGLADDFDAPTLFRCDHMRDGWKTVQLGEPASGQIKQLTLRRASTFLGVGADVAIQKCFGRPLREPVRSIFDLLNGANASRRNELD